jgi:hypothetical protein
VAEEELESAVGDLERIRLPLLIILDEQQIATEVVFGCLVGRLLEPLGELADSAEVGLVRPITQACQLQVLEHLLGERGEGDAFSLGGGRRRADGSVRIRGTTCHGAVLLNQYPRT